MLNTPTSAASTKQVRVADINICYQIDAPENPPAGGAATVLLSNSLASNLTMWNAQVGALTAAGFKVVRYDSRGHGQSDAPVGPYSIAQLAQDAVGLIDALELGRVHLCGLSKGGMVAQYIGAAHADKVLSLTICASAAHLGGAEVWQPRIDAVSSGGMRAIAEATLQRWFTPAAQTNMPGELDAVRAMILSTPDVGFIACCHAIMQMDQRASNTTIRTPTRVIVGADDPSTTPAHAAEIANAIAGASLVEIPASAHLLNIEQAAAFNDALLEHLRANT